VQVASSNSLAPRDQCDPPLRLPSNELLQTLNAGSPLLLPPAGALLGGFSSTGLGLFSLARLLQVYGRERLLPPLFAHVHVTTKTPVAATLAAGLVTGEALTPDGWHMRMLTA
jgi:hypothetical protein